MKTNKNDISVTFVLWNAFAVLVCAIILILALGAYKINELRQARQPTVYLNGVIAKPHERLHVYNGEAVKFPPYKEPVTVIEL